MALTGTDRGTGSATGTSYVVTLSSNLTAGALAVLVVAYTNAGGGGADPYSSISDSKGNTWTSRQICHYDPGVAGAGVDLRMWTSPQNVGALTTTDTITVVFSASVSASDWALQEVTAGAGNTADYLSGGIGTGATTGTPTVTTSSITSGDMVIGGAGTRLGSPWTGDSDTSNGSWSAQQAGTSSWAVTSQRKVTTGTATQTYNPTCTSDPTAIAWISVHETVPAAGQVPYRNRMPQLIAH